VTQALIKSLRAIAKQSSHALALLTKIIRKSNVFNHLYKANIAYQPLGCISSLAIASALIILYNGKSHLKEHNLQPFSAKTTQGCVVFIIHKVNVFHQPLGCISSLAIASALVILYI